MLTNDYSFIAGLSRMAAMLLRLFLVSGTLLQGGSHSCRSHIIDIRSHINGGVCGAHSDLEQKQPDLFWSVSAMMHSFCDESVIFPDLQGQLYIDQYLGAHGVHSGESVLAACCDGPLPGPLCSHIQCGAGEASLGLRSHGMVVCAPSIGVFGSMPQDRSEYSYLIPIRLISAPTRLRGYWFGESLAVADLRRRVESVLSAAGDLPRSQLISPPIPVGIFPRGHHRIYAAGDRKLTMLVFLVSVAAKFQCYYNLDPYESS